MLRFKIFIIALSRQDYSLKCTRDLRHIRHPRSKLLEELKRLLKVV